MPVPEHIRITALGRLGTPQAERFSYGVNMAETNPSPIGWFTDANNPSFQDIANDVVAFHASAGARISARAVLDTVKIARIGPDPANPNRGIYLANPKVFAVNQAGAFAATGEGLVPQSALAVSLNTARRGPTGKGRFYLPMPVVVSQHTDSFRIAVTDAEAVRGAAVSFINALNNHPGVDMGDLDVCVISTKGYASRVTSVRVGRIVDTISTRRRALGESYTANANVA